MIITIGYYKIGCHEIGCNEIGCNELGFNKISVITNQKYDPFSLPSAIYFIKFKFASS